MRGQIKVENDESVCNKQGRNKVLSGAFIYSFLAENLLKMSLVSRINFPGANEKGRKEGSNFRLSDFSFLFFCGESRVIANFLKGGNGGIPTTG